MRAPRLNTPLHIMQITNHGLHEWQITPGLPDTGGQNVYVNQMSAAFVRLGHRVTIVNRGGYPHPLTGKVRTGEEIGLGGKGTIVYLNDDTAGFVPKEEMAAQLPALSDQLAELLRRRSFDLMVSHYWDGGMLGILANREQEQKTPHIWIPHSLGALKRRNVDPDEWRALRGDERVAAEEEILEEVDGVAATSAAIRESLLDSYSHRPAYFLPPGVEAERYHPRAQGECDGIWQFLAEQGPNVKPELRHRRLILEVSRTDRTKRKDILIRAFAEVRAVQPDALLAVTIDAGNQQLHDDLLQLIEDLGLAEDVVVLGSVWDLLPCLYSVSAVYCTPSVMEGFGMSAQEAAASGTPVVASDRVPFVTEYLIGDHPRRSPVSDTESNLVGAGAIVVRADSVQGFAQAVTLLLADEPLRAHQGLAAFAMTVPAFAWDGLAARFLDDVVADNGQRL